jgi:hypothetical protein
VLAAASRAQTVDIDLDPAKTAAVGLDSAGLEAELSALISDKLYTGDTDAYVAKYANASALAIKGMGVDYASNPKKFVIGASIGPAVSGVPFSLTRGPDALPEGGFAFMAAAHAGINLGLLVPGDTKSPLDHVMVYVNGMAFNPPAQREFQASMYNLGAHLQISVGGPVEVSKVVEWGGIAITGGYELSSYKLSLASALPLTQQVDLATVTWTATGTYDLGATATTIPIELSTNLRLAVLTPYIGGAIDLNTAQASSLASLSGPITASAAGVTEALGSASVSIDGAGAADPVVPRVFGGLQLNISAFKIYGHVNVGFNDSFGAHVGTRVAL